MAKFLSGPKARLFELDILKVFAGAALTSLAPLAVNPGLSHVRAAQWIGIGDHAASALVLAALALLGTPITRKYGVGSAPTPPPAA